MKPKTVLVAGGPTAIGLATAKLLAADGRQVVVIAHLSDESSSIVGDNVVVDGGVRLT